jgi:hypothetical protein
MSSGALGVFAGHCPSKLHGPEESFSARPQFTGNYGNHSNPNLEKTATGSAGAKRKKNTPINSVWVNKIGDQVVGIARLVQNGPHSAEIVLFRVAPDWSHTKVALNLIRSIESFCQQHGQLDVVMRNKGSPPWILALMNQHGFRTGSGDEIHGTAA